MTGSRRAAVGAVLLVLGIGAAWMARDSAHAELAPREGSARVPDGGADDAALAGAPVDFPEPAAPSLAAERAAVPVAPDEARAGVPAVIPVEGRVVVVALDGRELEGESGELAVFVRHPPSYGRERVVVTEGRFEIDVPAGARLSALGALLGGRVAYASRSAATQAAARDVPVRFVVVENAASVLRVEDRATGEALNGIEVRFGAGWYQFPDIRVPPSSATPVAVGDRSPIALDPLVVRAASSEGTLYARAPGYAWACTQVDLGVGGEYLLQLGAGGALEVTVEGAVPEDAALFVRAPDAAASHLAWSRLPVGEPLRIEGLPAGPARVSAELGPLVLASGEVEVVAGLSTVVHLELAPLPEPELAPLSGVVVLPAEWELRPRSLVLGRIEPSPTGRRSSSEISLSTEPEPGTDDVYPFDAGELETGRYRASLSPPFVGFELELPPGGLTTARLAVAPPVEVFVRVVEAGTGEPLAPRVLLVGDSPSPGAPVSAYSAQTFGAARGGFSLRVPEGEVAVRIPAFEQAGRPFALAEERLPARAGAGEGEQVVAVIPGQAVRVRCRAGEQVVPPAHVEASFAGPGERNGMAWGDEDRLYFLSEPGNYELTCHPPAGYRTPEPRAVVVTTGEIVELVIELEREG